MAYSSSEDDVHINVVPASPRELEQHEESSSKSHVSSFSGPALRSRWFLAATVAIVLVVAVVVPLAVTVANLKTELEKATKNGLRGAVLSAGPQPFSTAAECLKALPQEPSPVGTPPPPLKLKGNKVVNAINGTDVQLHGVNWFGFNNGKTMVDGLDAGNGTWLAADFATIVFRMKLLGFNAVRLPFSFKDLEAPTQEYARPCEPADPLNAFEIGQATIPKDTAAGYKDRMPAAEFLVPMNSETGMCNAYLPNGPTTLPRFLWVVEYFVASGMYVLIDYHPHDTEPNVLSDPSIFAKKWSSLWSAFNCLPNFSDLKGRVMLDLLNEPDEYGMGWSGGPAREYKGHGSYLIAAMDAIDSMAPGQAIFYIQGGGQTKLGTSWGDGFASDVGLVTGRGVEDPNLFFKELLSKPYRKQVVLSPHFYGQSITKSTLVDNQLWEAFSQSWGNLMTYNGYCVPGGECQRFPVVIGEIGSKLENELDVRQYNDMAKYLKKLPPTDQPQFMHEPVSGWFWFAWNANSNDTGGLVQNDWETLEWPKITWLTENLDLQSWWMMPTLKAPEQPPKNFVQPLPKPQYNKKRVPRNPTTSHLSPLTPQLGPTTYEADTEPFPRPSLLASRQQ